MLHHIGSYSESRGIDLVRKHTAEFIHERDGVPCDYDSVYLVNGASEGIKTMLYVVMGDECSSHMTGVMIPTPQYPLYTAALAELGAYPVSGSATGTHTCTCVSLYLLCPSYCLYRICLRNP